MGYPFFKQYYVAFDFATEEVGLAKKFPLATTPRHIDDVTRYIVISLVVVLLIAAIAALMALIPPVNYNPDDYPVLQK
jgi:hypothetical protein